MLYVLKAFAANAAFTNNAIGQIAQIGEISTQSLTYSIQKGYYTSSVAPGVTFTTFNSTFDGVQTELTTDIVNHIATISEYIYNQSLTETTQMYADQLLNSLLSTFASVANTFTCGNIIFDGTHYMPEWVSWKNISIPTISGFAAVAANNSNGSGNSSGAPVISGTVTPTGTQDPDNVIKLWFVDQSFRNEYDQYQITVVPPLTPLDQFFTPSSDVQIDLNAITPQQTMANIQAAKNGSPESIVATLTYNYIDPMNSANVIPTNWNVLIYGQAGNNPDAITQALINYVLANSAHPESDWVKILPTLFTRTEFVLLPLWDQYAIPERVVEAGIYSPITNVAAAVALLTQVEPSYPAAFISANAAMLVQPYKSLPLITVGSPNNLNAAYSLVNVFPDFISVSSTSEDFNRMSQPTQDWALLLADWLPIAESMTNFTSVPQGMTTMTRDNILYLVQEVNNIFYLIAAKSNFPIGG